MAQQVWVPRSDLLVYVDSGRCRSLYAYRAAHLSPDEKPQPLQLVEELGNTAKSRYLARLRTFAEHGQLRGEFGHPLDGKKTKGAQGLYEFKDTGSQSRIVAFPEGAPGVYVLVYAFGDKKENKTNETHIVRAIELRDEYIRRRDAGARQMKGK